MAIEESTPRTILLNSAARKGFHTSSLYRTVHSKMELRMNRSPTTALKDETPFERLFGRRPDISHLRVFGCVSYVHVPDGQ